MFFYRDELSFQWHQMYEPGYYFLCAREDVNLKIVTDNQLDCPLHRTISSTRGWRFSKPAMLTTSSRKACIAISCVQLIFIYLRRR